MASDHVRGRKFPRYSLSLSPIIYANVTSRPTAGHTAILFSDKSVFTLYPQDHKGTQLYLGINHCGILTFQGSRKTHHFRWSEVQKINYEGKMFIVHLTINEVRERCTYLAYIVGYTRHDLSGVATRCTRRNTSVSNQNLSFGVNSRLPSTIPLQLLLSFSIGRHIFFS